jgi:hypothetical protein
MVFYLYGCLIFVPRPLSNAPKQIIHIIDKFQCNITTSSNGRQQGMLVGCLWVDFSVPFRVITVTSYFFILRVDEYIQTFLSHIS